MQALTDTPQNYLRAELQKALNDCNCQVLGNPHAVKFAFIAFLAGGHLLIEDLPGLGKTTLARTLADSLGLAFKRIQFTADLLPSDILGVSVYDPDKRRFDFHPGAVFTSILLADEINRASPRVQSALLESMNEGRVTLDGETRELPQPFLVIATRNDTYATGTFPLPEPQLDRFHLKLTMPIPARDDDIDIVTRHAAGFDPRDLVAAGVRAVADVAALDEARRSVATVTISSEVAGYVVDLARATRSASGVELGVSPRGSTALLAAARAWAWLSARDFVTPDDVKTVAKPAWRHRLQLRAEAQLEGSTADGVLDAVLSAVPVPR